MESLENLEEDILHSERLTEVRREVSKLPAEDMTLVIYYELIYSKSQILYLGD